MTAASAPLQSMVLREIRLRLREPFRISSGMVHDRRILLLELIDADGVAAWSECVAGESPNYSAETIDTAWLAITSWAAPRVIGRAFDDPSLARAALDPAFRGHEMAKAAVEMGVWALHAERAGLPLARVLGGTRERVDVGISLGIEETPEALVRRVLEARDRGYRRIKLKIAPGFDVDRVYVARGALGFEPVLSVDANAAYTLADADHLRLLDAFQLAMIEQPFEGGDLLRHAELQRGLRTPICLDESITSAARADDMIRTGAGRIINIKPGRVGGFSAAMAIHDVCTAADVPVWCGGMLESGIGRAHNIALASLPNFRLPGDLSPSARYWDRDIVTPEWTMRPDGTVDVPLDRPGIGVDVDRDRIDGLTVRSAVLD